MFFLQRTMTVTTEYMHGEIHMHVHVHVYVIVVGSGIGFWLTKGIVGLGSYIVGIIGKGTLEGFC